MKILELFSGIGGMHYAVKEVGLEAEVVAAVDINTIANTVYKHNFPQVHVMARNIQSLTAKEVNEMNIDMLLMSPPCQPFTRVGLKKDISDQRTTAFMHIINLIPNINSLKYVLMENVKGFEVSEARIHFVKMLSTIGFTFQEFLLNPMQFGIPNTRLRYYLLAKKTPLQFCFQIQEDIMTEFPSGGAAQEIVSSLNSTHRKMATEDEAVENEERVNSDGGSPMPPCYAIGRILNETEGGKFSNYFLPDKMLGKCSIVLDVVTPRSKRSCCFTKAYGHYADGTGSVITHWNMTDVHKLRLKNRELPVGCKEQIDEMKLLNLRFFTEREISRLMCFPEEPHFTFPENVTIKQKYRLLGNSVNVHVIAMLVSLLITGDNNE